MLEIACSYPLVSVARCGQIHAIGQDFSAFFFSTPKGEQRIIEGNLERAVMKVIRNNGFEDLPCAVLVLTRVGDAAGSLKDPVI